MKTAKQVYKEIVSPVGNFEGGTLMDEIIRAMEEYASQFKPTPSSTVDLERDYWQQRCLAAEDVIKHSTLVQTFGQNAVSYPPQYYTAREKLHKLQSTTHTSQTTSQKGLVELIEWMGNPLNLSISEFTAATETFIPKATELLTKK